MKTIEQLATEYADEVLSGSRANILPPDVQSLLRMSLIRAFSSGAMCAGNEVLKLIAALTVRKP